MKVNEARSLLNKNVRIGDARGKVYSQLKNTGINFSYDKYQNQYYATIRDDSCDPYRAISIDVIFDKDDNLLDIKVVESFTMP